MNLDTIAVAPRKVRFAGYDAQERLGPDWEARMRDGTPIPCAGYKSQTAAVWAMHADGLSNMQIRKATGLPRATVARAVFTYRRKHKAGGRKVA